MIIDAQQSEFVYLSIIARFIIEASTSRLLSENQQLDKYR